MSRQSTEGDNEDETSSMTSRRQHSLVWSCFEKIEGATPADRTTGCHNCGANPGSGTRNLKRHMLKCFNIQEGEPPQKRTPLDQDMYREKMAIAIIKHNYPFSYVEHQATRQLHQFLHRDATPICRNSVKKDVLAIYEREKTNLKMKLEKVSGRISFTADLWSSITSDGYIALTAHYVDEIWISRKKVLNFSFVPHPHTAGLKVIERSIEKVRESVKYVRGSSTRKTSFAECIAQLQLQCGRLVSQDVVTRWNSTYMMLDCTLVYQNAYARLDLVDINYTCCPTPEEWTRIREISKFLKPFYEITTLFSGNSYPTSN
ncbi:zinc finger BED domain-containing protein RICESLEEPER 2-like protein [Tanacetum coccineum]